MGRLARTALKAVCRKHGMTPPEGLVITAELRAILEGRHGVRLSEADFGTIMAILLAEALGLRPKDKILK